MIRRLMLTACFIAAGAEPALAQTHAGSHDYTYPHGPEHVRPDAGTHELMHALFHGSWIGTLSSHQGVSSRLEMSMTHDNLRRIALMMRTTRPVQVGAATQVVLNGDKLQWTQDMAGTLCKGTAVLSNATRLAPETLNGKMACKDREMTFALHKKAG